MHSLDHIKKYDFKLQADVLKLLGHPIRLKILCGLLSGQCTVGTLWNCLGISQSTVSQHLSILRNKGIVQAHRKGKTVEYKVSDAFSARVAQYVKDNVIKN